VGCPTARMLLLLLPLLLLLLRSPFLALLLGCRLVFVALVLFL
jgi:hypothetical protein